MADFTFTPHRVTPETPDFGVEVSDPKLNGPRETIILDTTPIERFLLEFDVVDRDTYIAMAAHYNGQFAGATTFVWSTVPSHVNNGNSLTVRYTAYKARPIGHRQFTVQIGLEVDY